MHHLGLKAGLSAGIFFVLQHQAFAQSLDVDDLRTGALPLSTEEFAALPKTPVYRAFLPNHTDLSARFPTPGDQGKQGSCTAWAVGYAARSYYAGSAEGRNVRDSDNIASPAYIYGSVVDDPKNCDGGSSIRSVLQLLKKSGSLSLQEYPYKASSCNRPSDNQQKKATDFRIENWEAVDFTQLDQVKGELARGNPVIVSLRTPKGFMKLRPGEVYSGSSTSSKDWHAVSILGYDEKQQTFKFINSWGAHWADNGFGRISYSAFLSEVREAYVMRPLRPVVPDPQPVVLLKPPKPPVNVIPKPVPTPNPVPAPPSPISTVVTNDSTCSDVISTEQAGQSVLSGFVDDEAQLAKLYDEVSNIHTSVKVKVRPWPQCEILQTLSKQIATSDKPVVKIENLRKLGQTGDYLKFSIKTPAYPSFLQISYVQADGSVVNLVQPNNLDLRAYAPFSTLELGDVKGTGPKFRVSAPFGREMLVVVASRSPLFDVQQPAQETDREFLTSLRKAILARPDVTSSERLISANFDTILTSDNAVISTEGSDQ